MPREAIEYEMVEHFGSLTEYYSIPLWKAREHELVWQGRNKARATQMKRDEDKWNRQNNNPT